jgi:hypothetical protein
LEQARQEEVDNLLFVARDGQIMLRAAQALIADRPAPRTSYLEVSRKSLLVASLPDVSLASLEEVLPRRPHARLDARLPRSGSTSRRWAARPPGSGVERHLGPAGHGRARDCDRAAADRQRGEPAIGDAVAAAARGVHGYLEQEGLLSGDGGHSSTSAGTSAFSGSSRT